RNKLIRNILARNSKEANQASRSFYRSKATPSPSLKKRWKFHLQLMIVDGSSPLPLKRRRFTNIDSMEAASAKAKLAAAKEKFGREIHVFETEGPSPIQNEVPSTEESDDFYEFTAEDYHQVMATKKEDNYLKTRKTREAEEAARRSRVTKAVIRVRFPDNHTLEVTFHPSETIQCLYDLIMKVISRPDLPFYLYTTPPKKQIKDMTLDIFSAGFIPGAIVYFSYDLPKGDDATAANSAAFLLDEVTSLKGLEVIAGAEQAEAVQSAPEPGVGASTVPFPIAQTSKPSEKKPGRPKWFKM
ncbi:hypothetical protein Goshw_000606, partial [Gossypium schwendimanii]|nr:hypothetical protein [Gossypium schwendimanii]